jgi:hypothetical protein
MMHFAMGAWKSEASRLDARPQPRGVADLVAFLATSRAASITGVEYVIDSGISPARRNGFPLFFFKVQSLGVVLDVNQDSLHPIDG